MKLKKVLATVLAVGMVLSLCACGGKEGEGTSDGKGNQASDMKNETDGTNVQEENYKIGILTMSMAVGEEEYLAAENVVEKYGEDKIIHMAVPDNTVTEQETTISEALSLAADPEVKAIIFNTAVEGTAAAMDKVREQREDILLIAGVINEAPDVATAAADLVYHPDVENMGNQVAEAASEMGAKTVIWYSFPRHMAQPLNVARRDAMKKRCEELKIDFVEVATPDPMSDSGVAAAQQFVLEDVPRQIEVYGKDTAFFCTNSDMHEALCKAIFLNKGLFPMPDNPSVFYAFPGALGIEVPEDKKGDVTYMQEQISEILAENDMEGRMGSWKVPAQTMYVNCSIQYAMDYCEGDITNRADLEAFSKIISEYAGDGVSVQKYTDPETEKTYDNFFVILGEHIIY